MSTCVFCEKFDDKGPGSVMIFAPLNPVVKGHLLVVPKKHVTDFADDPTTTALVMADAAMYAKRTGKQYNLITSKGEDATQSVFHLHVHLVPRQKDDGLMLPWTNQSAPTPAQEVGKSMAVFTVNEPYDSLIRILSKLQFKAAKKDLTGIFDAASEILELYEPKPAPSPQLEGDK